MNFGYVKHCGYTLGSPEHFRDVYGTSFSYKTSPIFENIKKIIPNVEPNRKETPMDIFNKVANDQDYNEEISDYYKKELKGAKYE